MPQCQWHPVSLSAPLYQPQRNLCDYNRGTTDFLVRSARTSVKHLLLAKQYDIMTSLKQGIVMTKTKKMKKEEDSKKNTSLRLPGKTLKALKVRAITEETSVQKIIETLIEDYLRRSSGPKE